MRNLFFITVLANLIYFVWHYNQGAFQSKPDEAALAAAAPKQIWLVSETEKSPALNIAALYHPSAAQPKSPVETPKTPPKQEKNSLSFLVTRTTLVNRTATIAPDPLLPEETAPTASLTKTESKTFHCYRIRLLADKAAVLRWARRQSLAPDDLQLKVNRPVTDRYMVNYPATANLEEAKQHVEELKNQGIDDFFMIYSGKFKGAISLGVFKDKMKAIKAQQLYREKGVPVEVSERHKTAATISATIRSDKNKSELLATLAGLKPSIELLSKCE